MMPSPGVASLADLGDRTPEEPRPAFPEARQANSHEFVVTWRRTTEYPQRIRTVALPKPAD